MHSYSKRDPKKFAQRTLAAAIASATLMASSSLAVAQTTGGGIGADVNSNQNLSTGTSASGTSGSSGGAGPGVAPPNAVTSPVNPASGPGINQTGSPALPTPNSLRTQIGGGTPGPRGTNGTSQLPGNTPGTASGGPTRSGPLTTPNTTNRTPALRDRMPGPGSAAAGQGGTSRPGSVGGGNNSSTNSGAANRNRLANPADAVNRVPGGTAGVNGTRQPGSATPRGPLPRSIEQTGAQFGMQMSGSKDGVMLSNVVANSVAERSGLLSGDRIQSLNGQSISMPADFARVLQSIRAGDRMTARVMREGTPRDVELTLPAGFSGAQENTGRDVGVSPAVVVGGSVVVTPESRLGITVPGVAGVGVIVPIDEGVVTGVPQQGIGTVRQPIAGTQRMANPGSVTAGNRTRTDSTVIGGGVSARDAANATTREALKVPDVDLGWRLKGTPEGVVLSELTDDGQASKSKFRPGDVIESIDGRPVVSEAALAYELHRHRGGTSVEVSILRGGARLTQPLYLPEGHKALLLETEESFGAANNAVKERGASVGNPTTVIPTDKSREVLEEENRSLRAEIEALRKKNP